MADGLGKCFNCERLMLVTFTYGQIVKLHQVEVHSEVRFYCSKCKELWDEVCSLEAEEDKQRYLKNLINFGDNEVAKINRSTFKIVQ